MKKSEELKIKFYDLLFEKAKLQNQLQQLDKELKDTDSNIQKEILQEKNDFDGKQ